MSNDRGGVDGVNHRPGNHRSGENNGPSDDWSGVNNRSGDDGSRVNHRSGNDGSGVDSLGVLGLAIVGHIGDEAVIAIGMVVDMLDPAVRKGDRV